MLWIQKVIMNTIITCRMKNLKMEIVKLKTRKTIVLAKNQVAVLLEIQRQIQNLNQNQSLKILLAKLLRKENQELKIPKLNTIQVQVFIKTEKPKLEKIF